MTKKIWKSFDMFKKMEKKKSIYGISPTVYFIANAE